MNQGTKTFLIIAGLIIIFGAGIILINKNRNKESSGTANTENGTVAGTQSNDETITQPSAEKIANADYIFFYGSTCPHCQKVEEWMDENDADNKINIVRLEVYSNQENQNLMQEKLDACTDIPEEDKGGVPFLYSKDKCIIGDQPIIDFLNSKL